MKKIGSTLLFFGLAAIVLNFVNMVPSVLMWIYSWGELTAWVIKIAIVVLGSILFLIGKKTEQEEETYE